MIDNTNSAQHSYPVYARQFKSYRWYKPLLVFMLFMIIYLIIGVIFTLAISAIVTGGSLSIGEDAANVFSSSYDDMDLANGWQTLESLGSVALMIPALWLATKIVRDRPFSSYSSSRGGWSSKVFWKVFPVAFICISVPILVDELIVQHRISNYHMRFTIASFLVLTILGPLQCIAEEYVFRGFLMQTIGSWFRLPVIAVILQSVVFVLMHPYNMIGKAEIFVSGMVFALAVWFGRGIEVSSAYHICNNMTIFYLQGMDMATISSETDIRSAVFSSICGIVYAAAIFIISRKTDWFDKIKRDDVTPWNQKVDEKLARKEARKAAKTGMQAVGRAPEGAHDEAAPGKHFKN